MFRSLSASSSTKCLSSFRLNPCTSQASSQLLATNASLSGQGSISYSHDTRLCMQTGLCVGHSSVCQHTLVLERWSTTRPGVPTMTWGLLPRAMACAIMSMPPTSTAHLTPMPEPSASNCSAIWIASSLVGDSTIAYSAWGFFNKPYMTVSCMSKEEQ